MGQRRQTGSQRQIFRVMKSKTASKQITLVAYTYIPRATVALVLH